MSDATDYDPVECPAGDCTYRDAVRSVAAHVSGSDDDAHSWNRLGYDGAREFVMTEKRRQRGELDADRGGTDRADRGETDPGDHADRGGFETASDASAGGSSGTDSTSASADSSAASADSSATSAKSSTATSDSPEVDEEEFELGFERDALVLLELASRYDLSSLDDLGTGQLADLYSLLADLKNSAEDARREVRDKLEDEIREDGTISATFGSVNRHTRTYRSLEDDTTVRAALDAADVDPDSVKSFDKSKLRDAVEDARLDEEAVFDVEERPRIQITESNDDSRRERFDRLDPEIRSLADDE